MGREIPCRAKSGGKWFAGKALLETTEIIFRGDLRLTIPFAALTSVIAREGSLHLEWSSQSVALDLGEQAEKWAHSIPSQEHRRQARHQARSENFGCPHGRRQHDERRS